MDYIDTMFDATNEISSISYELLKLSNAFYITGNEHMAEDLKLLANDLEKASENINEAVGQEQNDRLKSARDGVAETLSLVLEHTLKG